MGFYVHVQVSFACDDNDGVAALAGKQRAADMEESCPEAAAFVRYLAIRSGRNIGPKGGVSVWGMIGNYTNVGKFVEVLEPFWKELLSGIEGGPCPFEHVVVLYEMEQSEKACAYEIYQETHRSQIKDGLIIKHHELPFCWNQM